jgi:hypothetical protein
MSGRTRLTGRKQPPPSLVQNWLKRLEASLDGSDVNHQARISAPAIGSRQFADPFVAFLSVPRFFPSDSLILAQALSDCVSPVGRPPESGVLLQGVRPARPRTFKRPMVCREYSYLLKQIPFGHAKHLGKCCWRVTLPGSGRSGRPANIAGSHRRLSGAATSLRS